MAQTKVQRTVRGLKRSGRQTRKNRGHLSTAMLEKIERRYKVVNLRRDGHTIQEIAVSLKVSEMMVRRDLIETMQFMAKNTVETVEEARQLEIQRLDKLVQTYTPFATQVQQTVVIDKATNQQTVIKIPPNPAYASILLSISQQRTKLLALAVPEIKKLEVSGVREYLGIDTSKV